MNPLATSLIRTVTPLIAGWLLSLPIAPALISLLGMSGDPTADKARVTGLVTAALSAAYYTAVRLLEQKYPKLGALLGRAVQPVYAHLGKHEATPPAPPPAG